MNASCAGSDIFEDVQKRRAPIAGHWRVKPVSPLLYGRAVWALTGPLFGFSDTWQLVVNTATTIVTFLMVFLIQNTQNRDSEAMQVKLDEIIRAMEGAENALLDLEELEDEELDRIRKDYLGLAERARDELRKRGAEASPSVEGRGGC